MNCDVQAIDSTPTRNDIDKAGKYAVLFYLLGGPYKVTATHLDIRKTELESFIKDVHGNEEEDWYQVDKEEDIQVIIQYARGPKVQGVTFNMVIVQ